MHRPITASRGAHEPLPSRAARCEARGIDTINVTTTDAARITAAHLLAAKPGRVVTISPSARIGEAVSLLVVHRIGALVVTEADGALAGIISERDIVWSLRHGPESMRAPVASIMTTDVRVADLATTCDRLMRTMSDERVRHLPILADGHVVGMVSIGDLVCALLGDADTGD